MNRESGQSEQYDQRTSPAHMCGVRPLHNLSPGLWVGDGALGSFRRLLTEICSAINFFAGVGRHDIGALGEVQVRRAALQPAPDERQFHSRFDRRWCPTELLDQLLWATKLRLPADRLAVL